MRQHNVTAADRRPTPPSRPRPVLVVDDESLIQLSLGRLLRLRGFAPISAATIAGAVRVTEDSAIEAVVLDLGLPGGESALDFLAWFRGLPRHKKTPVMILTGHAYLGPEQMAIIKRYHSLVFYKPVSFATLDHCLELLLGGVAPAVPPKSIGFPR